MVDWSSDDFIAITLVVSPASQWSKMALLRSVRSSGVNGADHFVIV